MTEETERLEREISKLWTAIDVQRVLRISHQTLQVWRRDYNLPTVCIRGDTRPALRFVPKDVRTWARQNNVRIYEEEVA